MCAVHCIRDARDKHVIALKCIICCGNYMMPHVECIYSLKRTNDEFWNMTTTNAVDQARSRPPTHELPTIQRRRNEMVPLTWPKKNEANEMHWEWDHTRGLKDFRNEICELHNCMTWKLWEWSAFTHSTIVVQLVVCIFLRNLQCALKPFGHFQVFSLSFKWILLANIVNGKRHVSCEFSWLELNGLEYDIRNEMWILIWKIWQFFESASLFVWSLVVWWLGSPTTC